MQGICGNILGLVFRPCGISAWRAARVDPSIHLEGGIDLLSHHMNKLQRLITSNGAFTPPIRILEAIPTGLRDARPARVPHSIVESFGTSSTGWTIFYLGLGASRSVPELVAGKDGRHRPALWTQSGIL
jgi:hypothetical protein